MATAIEGALRQLSDERRDAVLEASLLETPAAAPLQARFGAQADTVAADLQNLGVGGSDLGTALRVLRERLEHELGREGFTARAEALAARLVAAGLWHDALGVLARASTPTVFGETLARALRAVPALDTEHALRWIEHVEDEHAIADGDLALTRAALHESRGDPDRALAVLRRALGGALVAGDQATGPRLSTEIARLSTGRTSDSSGHARSAAPAAPRRWPAVVSVGVAGLCVALAAWPGASHLWAFVWLLLGAITLMMSRVVPEFAVGLMLITGWVLLGSRRRPRRSRASLPRSGSSSSPPTAWRRPPRARGCCSASGCCSCAACRRACCGRWQRCW